MRVYSKILKIAILALKANNNYNTHLSVIYMIFVFALVLQLGFCCYTAFYKPLSDCDINETFHIVPGPFGNSWSLSGTK